MESPHPQRSYLHLFSRASDPNNPPLTSVFALIINRAQALASSGANALAKALSARSTHRSSIAVSEFQIVKRQQQILVIPTTYANINSSPKPGAVVGITLGAIFGFLLALTIMVLVFRAMYGETEVVEEEIVTRRSRHSHSVKKHSPSASSVSEAPPIPEPEPEPVIVASRRSSRVSRRESRASRRTSRMSRRTPEEVIVEEELSSVHDRRPEEVIVVEEESSIHDEPAEVTVEEEEEDIVEVIEEHSPEPPPRRKSSARRSSTFRTIDPAEYGGGDAPSRRISRQSRGS